MGLFFLSIPKNIFNADINSCLNFYFHKIIQIIIKCILISDYTVLTLLFIYIKTHRQLLLFSYLTDYFTVSGSQSWNFTEEISKFGKTTNELHARRFG